MAGKTPELQILGEALTRQYRLACELYNTFPIGRITYQLSQGSLCVDLSAIDHDHMEAICHLLQSKKTPKLLKFNAPTSTEVGPRIIQQAMRGLTLCVAQSLTLNSLELCNLRLKGNTFEMLCQGLSKSQNIKTLSIVSCSLRDSGIERLCQSIKNVPSISDLSLTDCYITEKGGETISQLVKHQRMNRDSAMWQDTLRLRHPHLDGMRGLRRITLNHNPHLGDSGAKALADALLEDLWIKAVDLQHCGIGTDGGLALKEILTTNHTIEVLDLRKNPFLPNHIVNDVMSLLKEREEEFNSTQYSWISLDSDQGVDEKLKTKAKVSERTSISPKKICKVKSQKRLKQPDASSKKGQLPPSKSGMPWRIEHRLYERREGLKPGSAIDVLMRGDMSTPLPTQDMELSQQANTAFVKKIKKLLSHYKHLYQKEKAARKRAERKLAKLQSKIEASHILDEGTVDHIERCFQKFQAFLVNLETTGLQWQAEVWEHPGNKSNLGELLTIGKPINPSYPPPSRDIHQDMENEGSYPLIRDSRLLSYSTIGHPFIFTNERLEKESLSPGHEKLKTVGKAQDLVRDSDTPLETAMGAQKSKIEVQPVAVDVDEFSSPQGVNDPGKRFTTSRIKSATDNVHRVRHENIPALDKFHSSEENDCSSSDGLGTVISNNEEDYTSQSREAPAVPVPGRQSLPFEKAPAVPVPGRQSLPFEKVDNKSQKIEAYETRAQQEGKKKLHEIDMKESRKESKALDYQAEMPGNNGIPESLPEEPVLLHPAGVDTTSEVLVQMTNDTESYLRTSGNMDNSTVISSPQNNKINNLEKDSSQADGTALEENESETTDHQISTQRSETDDEKLQMKTIRQAARRGSVSSLSITEQLSHSHSSWTGSRKQRHNNHFNKTLHKNKRNEIPILDLEQSKEMESSIPVMPAKDNNIMDYDSDFEVSDVEGLSISASSLTSTTIPDDLVTPGEEEF